MDWNNINRDRDTSGLGPIEYAQTKVPSLIRQYADDVRTKTYGQEVREAQARNAEIAGLIASEAVDISNETKSRQDTVENQFNSVQQELTDKDVISAPEIITARAGENTLNERLTKEFDKLSDLSLNVRDFKTDLNTWNQALQLCVDEGNRLSIAEQENGNVYIPRNVLIKMPRGRYVISETIIGKRGLNFDFDGCTFVAENMNKTINFMDMTSCIFRNEYNKGAFVGFNKVLIASTGNLDTSLFVWNNPTFQECAYGIDTVSYDQSRSTVVEINNIYSIKTDQPLKVHSDMCSINGGWIYHTGYDGASIYNQGLTKIENVLFVPSPPLSTNNQPRWIDNHSEDEDSTNITGERGIVVDHCRFGGEGGSMPIVFNFAKANTTMTSYKSTIVSIENSYATAVGTSNKSLVVLHALPNRIKISNVSGIINLTDGIIKNASNFDSKTVGNSPYISIDLDNTLYGHPSIKFLEDDLYRFLKTKENLNTQFRSTFYDGKTHKRYKSESLDNGNKKITVNLNNTGVSDNYNFSYEFGFGFLVAIQSTIVPSASYINQPHALFYVSSTSGMSSGQKVKKVNISTLASHKGGVDFVGEVVIDKVVWSKSQTDTAPLTSNESVDIIFESVYPAYATVIPIFGNDSEVR